MLWYNLEFLFISIGSFLGITALNFIEKISDWIIKIWYQIKFFSLILNI
jgi:hypothetical protein